MKSKQVKWTSLVGVFALVGMSLLSACGDDSASPLAPQVSGKESSSSMQKSSSSVQRTSVKSLILVITLASGPDMNILPRNFPVV